VGSLAADSSTTQDLEGNAVNFSEFYLAKSERRMKKEENMCYIFGQPLKFGVYILSPASFVGQERA